jgi:hypothetical protein
MIKRKIDRNGKIEKKDKSSHPSLKSSFTSWSRECNHRGTGQGRLSDARDCVHWEPQPGSFDLDEQERRQVDPRQARLEQGRPGSSAAAALLSPLLLHRYNHAEGAPFGRRKRVWSPCVERCEHCYQNQLSWKLVSSQLFVSKYLAGRVGTGRVRTSNTFLLLWEFSNNFFLNRCYFKAVCTEPGDGSAFFLDPIPAVFSLKINNLIK